MTGGTSNQTLIKRAQDVASRIKLEQEALINSLNRDLMQKRADLDAILDIGPDDTTSMRPTKTGFDPAVLVTNVQDLRVEILELEIQVKVANETLADWLGTPTPAEEASAGA